MTIHAGDLRYLATFKNPTPVVIDGDTTLTPFAEDFKGWVGIQPLAGGEETVGDQMQTFRAHLVTARYDRRINERMHILVRGRILQIASVLNVDERNVEMQLTCKELV